MSNANEFIAVPQPYKKSHDAALKFSQAPSLQRAFEDALRDEKLMSAAIDDLPRFLESHGVTVPGGLEIRLVGASMPGPDWVPFTIRLLRCRKYYRKTKDGVEEAEVCFGFEIIPNPVPGGPWG